MWIIKKNSIKSNTKNVSVKIRERERQSELARLHKSAIYERMSKGNIAQILNNL